MKPVTTLLLILAIVLALLPVFITFSMEISVLSNLLALVAAGGAYYTLKQEETPKKSKDEVKVLRDKFLSAARRASIFTDQDSMAIKLDINKTKMTISKNTPYLGEAKEEIGVDYNGDNLEIGFNPQYLIDVLKSLSEEEITLEVSEPNKPGVIRLGEEYIYVVLPMQLNI